VPDTSDIKTRDFLDTKIDSIDSNELNRTLGRGRRRGRRGRRGKNCTRSFLNPEEEEEEEERSACRYKNQTF
jgi:hypothetical protein